MALVAGAVALVAGSLALAAPVAAEELPLPPPAPAAPPAVVRLALSPRAAEHLFELRMRRLLQIELDDAARVDAGIAGQLGGDLILVWIDLPEPRRAVIEVRRINGALARRSIAVGGFPADVAAEAVALAAAEMVRVQARVPPTKRPSEQPRKPVEAADMAAFGLGAATDALFLPASEPLALGGPRLTLELGRGLFSQSLYGRWLFGEGDRRARWLEVGGSVGLRFGLGEAWRLGLDLGAAFVDVSFPGASTIDGERNDDAWTVHARGGVHLRARVDREAWLSLGVEAGAAVRSLAIVDANGEGELGGFALGLSLGVIAAPEPQGVARDAAATEGP
jgi:hypothetical protein